MSGVPGAIEDWAWRTRILWRVRDRLRGPKGKRPALRVDFKHDGYSHDIAVSRERSGFRLSFSPEIRRAFVLSVVNNFRAYVYWLSFADDRVQRITVNATDGQLPSLATFAPSARPGAHVLIPDPHFYLSRGFSHARAQGAAAPDWGDRSAKLLWRGSTNGYGRMSFDPGEQDDPTVAQRYRLVMKARAIPDSDIRFSKVPGVNWAAHSWTTAGRHTGLLGGRIEAHNWSNSRYALDIDGGVNTWSNLLVRLHLGCCVLKVASQFGFRQWYYDRLKPWEHYVPVEADMRDLAEKVDWVRSHDSEARAIAANGQALARTLDFKSVRQEAADIITANWERPPPSRPSPAAG